MSWKLFGDLLLVAMILSAPVIFAVANANYLPDTERREEEGGTEKEARR